MIDLSIDVYSKASRAVEILEGEDDEGYDEEKDEDENHTQGWGGSLELLSATNWTLLESLKVAYDKE